ncbi:hypothetical protein [Dapis sp. BLCC M229]|uniref:hypothetical protein n=1 Tax=Dapis sp. BLCC M229 TaxID=3400188 RepID=UPI003CF623DD
MSGRVCLAFRSKAERMFYRYLIRINLKSKNYKVGVFWFVYFWREAIAILSKFSRLG